VYIGDEQGRVCAFLQKPSVAEMEASGGIREDGLAAVDSGLVRFDPHVAARLLVPNPDPICFLWRQWRRPLPARSDD
jgi:hypothetical protein